MKKTLKQDIIKFGSFLSKIRQELFVWGCRLFGLVGFFFSVLALYSIYSDAIEVTNFLDLIWRAFGYWVGAVLALAIVCVVIGTCLYIVENKK